MHSNVNIFWVGQNIEFPWIDETRDRTSLTLSKLSYFGTILYMFKLIVGKVTLLQKIFQGSSGIWTRDLSHPKRESYP